jgi:acetyltransferase
MGRTKIYEALKGVRGEKPVNLEHLEQILVNFSRFILENPRIAECDINPLLASAGELIALDARIVIHDQSISDDNLPKPAIRPYPIQWVESYELQNSKQLTIRPIRPEDEPAMERFHQGLSDKTVKERFIAPFSLQERIKHERLLQICSDDYDREMALIAETKEQEIIGIVRLSKIIGTQEAQFKILIADNSQNQGLGTHLLKTIIDLAREEKISRLFGIVAEENKRLLHICKKLGFSIRSYREKPPLELCELILE